MNDTSTRGTIEIVVLESLRLANRSRAVGHQLAVDPDAALFGAGSPLDSLGLVALAIDVEDGLRDKGLNVELSDSHALSQRHSPFRTVRALVDYIALRIEDAR